MDTDGFNKFLKQSENEARLEEERKAAEMESEEDQINAAIKLSKQQNQYEQLQYLMQVYEEKKQDEVDDSIMEKN